MLSTVARLTKNMHDITTETHNISITNPNESYGCTIEPCEKHLEQVINHVRSFLNAGTFNLTEPFNVDKISGDNDWFEVNLRGQNSQVHNVLFVATKK